MTSDKKESVDPHQCQTQIDENLTMDASTELPIINNRIIIICYDDTCFFREVCYLVER